MFPPFRANRAIRSSMLGTRASKFLVALQVSSWPAHLPPVRTEFSYSINFILSTPSGLLNSSSALASGFLQACEKKKKKNFDAADSTHLLFGIYLRCYRFIWDLHNLCFLSVYAYLSCGCPLRAAIFICTYTSTIGKIRTIFNYSLASIRHLPIGSKYFLYFSDYSF